MPVQPNPSQQEKHETDVVGTLMSLTVAFALAMAFRGFVLEGFVIPTGSMGPTLMGAHVRVKSAVTGYEYPADAQIAQGMAATGDPRPLPVIDPMLSSRTAIGAEPPSAIAAEARAGDRVLVLKPLFAFSDPQRWDVTVFKNPTDPAGDTQNYIKRMVGLPNETFLLVDGDVFTGAPDARTQDLRIQRKPEHVQRAVWQPVYDSTFEPMVPLQKLEAAMRSGWTGAPWRPAPGTSGWKTVPGREWTFSGSGATQLDWSGDAFPLDDWNAYNVMRLAYDAMHRTPKGLADPAWRADVCFPVSDLRLSATVQCDQLAKFSTDFQLVARRSVFSFAISGAGTVTVTRSPQEGGPAVATASATFSPRTDGILAFECWHVDQQLWVFVDGRNVLQVPYEFANLDERVTSSCLGRTAEQYATRHFDTHLPTPPKLSWKFESAAPFSLRRVKLDRDLYYRPVLHDANNQMVINCPVDGAGNPQYLSGPGFATDYLHPAHLGPRDFVMLGDNSFASSDARLWGRAHALTLRTFGDAQPGVVPREMIVGKAWAVYFPSPLGLWQGGLDFGRVRFIR
jgi:hypothetical protein